MSLSSKLKTINVLASQLDTLEIYLLMGDVTLEAYVDITEMFKRISRLSRVLESAVLSDEVEWSDEERELLENARRNAICSDTPDQVSAIGLNGPPRTDHLENWMMWLERGYDLTGDHDQS